MRHSPYGPGPGALTAPVKNAAMGQAGMPDTIRITVKTEEDGNKHLYFEALKANAERPEEKPVAQASSDAT